jgi:hypothetical protein
MVEKGRERDGNKDLGKFNVPRETSVEHIVKRNFQTNFRTKSKGIFCFAVDQLTRLLSCFLSDE